MSLFKRAIYAGTFDPITFGHLDLIRRSSCLVDHLIVAIAHSHQKGTLFSVDERLDMVKTDVATLERRNERITIQTFSSLLMDFAIQKNAQAIIRGLRGVSDFEYEFQMSTMNARLNAQIETIFLMTSESHYFISSRLVKEIAFYGGSVTEFVSRDVAERLAQRLGPERKQRVIQ